MKFIEYAEHTQAPQFILDWVRKNIKEEVPTEEGEHIIDYLVSEDGPKRLVNANYEDTKRAAEKWLQTQIKKGNNIKETESDTEVILDFGDGFKVVKLVGENAYKREGFLMRHCVQSYYGKDVEVYSLRDKDNVPHCTMEKDRQVKGRGNGDIAPKYVDYIVKFLQSTGMNVGDSEMKHLGYINIEKLLPELAVNTVDILYAGKYFPTNKDKSLLKDKEGNVYMGMSLLDYFPMLVEQKTDTSFKLKLNFDMSAMAEYTQKVMQKKSRTGIDRLKGGYFAKLTGGNSAQLSGNDSAKLSGGYSAQLSAGNFAQLSAGDHAKISAGNFSQLSGGNYAQLSGGKSAQLSGGDSAKLSGGNYAQLSGGDSAKLSGGDSAKLSGGYSAQLSGGNSAKLSGGDSAQLSGGNFAQMMSGFKSTLSSAKHAIVVGDNQSKASGKMGTLIVLANRKRIENEWVITEFKAALVDGKQIKEDVFYKLEGGELIEAE